MSEKTISKKSTVFEDYEILKAVTEDYAKAYYRLPRWVVDYYKLPGAEYCMGKQEPEEDIHSCADRIMNSVREVGSKLDEVAKKLERKYSFDGSSINNVGLYLECFKEKFLSDREAA
jgi:hypothetical protein